MTDSNRLPTLFIPHGGGPCFFMKPEDMPPTMPPGTWDPMARFLRGIADTLPQRPSAVIVVTAHWQTQVPTIGNAAKHRLLYDYYGFPPYTYELTYPVAGDPALAARIADLLADAGIASTLDGDRGIDHGVFVPLKLVFPDADVPIVPLSLRHDLDPAAHLAIGAALAPLRDEGVLIIGSGMSFHNMRAMMTQAVDGGARIFDDWLDTAVSAAPADRDAMLADWQSAPRALYAHPEAEHLLPLMVAAGAAGGDRGRRVFNDAMGSTVVSGFRFG